MNAVEIEEAVSELAGAPFDPAEFPFAFLAAFGNKDTTVRKLRQGASNRSDVPGGVLQRNHIHIATSPLGRTEETLAALRQSPATYAQKAKFILATDGETLLAEELASGEALACSYAELADHFGFLLPLAGITTVKEIKNNPIDIKATSRLNKLYVQLLKDNEDWGTVERRPALNQFMARLIFCFFAEDTGIFLPQLFTRTVEQMSEASGANTHEVLAELFRAMNIDTRPDGRLRRAAGVKSWADGFPYVNGGLFTGGATVPRFSRMARSYLLAAGRLDWKEINPDIFGSMIQAVADDDERGELGMHYTSVPNILKVLNPLFLDSLRDQLEAAAGNARKLRNLRKRLAAIRVFDPACGSGNFLVIAYLRMREIEHEIVTRTGDEPTSVIQLGNFYGIEIKSFAAEIARLSLLIAEFQADVRHISQQRACEMVLPLDQTGKIQVGNALRMDWLEVCPPMTKSLVAEHDLAGPTGRLALEDHGLAETGEPETYICGNPPYGGSKWQSAEQKEDLRLASESHVRDWKSLDYVAGWFVKAVEYSREQESSSAFVTTNSISQGLMVSVLWPYILRHREIGFAHTSFKWANLAARNAGVTVAVIGLRARSQKPKIIYAPDEAQATRREVSNINPYLVPANDVIVSPAPKPTPPLATMFFGNMPRDGGNLCLNLEESESIRHEPGLSGLVKQYIGSEEMINGGNRGCLWITDEDLPLAKSHPVIAERLDRVTAMRLSSAAPSTRAFASRPHRFVQIAGVAKEMSIAVAKVSSETRPYLPAAIFDANTILSDLLFGMYDAPLWNLSLVISRIHLIWVATVCGKLETRYRYSNTLGWNTFPVPPLTEANKAELTARAEDILLAREAHFPATIAELYDPGNMPENLRRAHEANDETLERIYIGRKFRNDTERLEKLFEMYVKITAGERAKLGKKRGKKVDSNARRIAENVSGDEVSA